MNNWVLDAQFFNDLNEEYIFRNPRINMFLKDDFSKFILVSSKGMGKTLLLRFKRKNIEENNKGALLIPKNETADYVNLPASLDKSFYFAMEKRVFWEDLWKLSISISCLLNFHIRISKSEIQQVFTEIEKIELPNLLKSELKASFENKRQTQRRPSEILDIILQAGKSNVENIRSKSMHILFGFFTKYVSSACIVFLDSFDQALMHNFSDNITIWCTAQTGLMKAAWELSRHNTHVKVYITVRQEAYASFDDAERLNISGSVVMLEYSKKDLQGVFESAIRNYEKCNSIEEFLGVKKIRNGYLGTKEDPFDYIFRHTIQVPRWLIKLGEELSTTRTERDIIDNAELQKIQQKNIAEIVNRVSADLAYDHIVSEMKMFFNGKDPKAFLSAFLNNIYSSVISYPGLERVSKKIIEDSFENESMHPFCLMYNLGFIGCIIKNANGRGKIQYFQKPYNFNWKNSHVLPIDANSYYFIHPALHHKAQAINPKFNFNKTKISDGLPWTKRQLDQINAESINIFISYFDGDKEEVNNIVNIFDEYLNEKSLIHNIWFDKWKMRGGKWISDQIQQGLDNSDFLVLMVSKESVQRPAVQVEWKTKFQNKLSKNSDEIFPLRIKGADLSDIPECIKPIYAYIYNNPITDKPNLIRLIRDIVFLKTEGLK